MKRYRTKPLLWITGMTLLLITVSVAWLYNGSRAIAPGMIICTEVNKDISFNENDMGKDRRYIPEARIIAFDPSNPGKSKIILTPDFYSARAPELSWDAEFMLFSAQKKENDTWQIWKMDLSSFEIIQLTECPVNCTDPAWLPDGRIVFSRLNNDEPGGSMHVIYICNADGSNKKRLTFSPNSAIASSIFHDGRIVLLSEQQYPDKGPEKIFAMRIDGTKSTLFYENESGNRPVSRSWESGDEMVYFIEEDVKNLSETRLISVDYGHPLSSRKDLSVNNQGGFNSIFPVSEEGLIVSYRPAADKTFGLFKYKIKNNRIGKLIYSEDEYNLVEPFLVHPRPLPRKLPSRVDESMDKGTFLCHNADISTLPVKAVGRKSEKTYKIQVYGINEMLGEVPVEKDGSFYIELKADKPVRFQAIDVDGNVIRGPSDWVWIRPNEHWSCIGCHEDRELAPENKVPDALYDGMVSLPDGDKAEAIVLSKRK